VQSLFLKDVLLAFLAVGFLPVSAVGIAELCSAGSGVEAGLASRDWIRFSTRDSLVFGIWIGGFGGKLGS
jgi:hypothetical protein